MNKISRIGKILKEEKADCFLISSPPNILYLTDFSSFSREEREVFILITKDKAYLVTDKRYSEEAKLKIKGFKIIEKPALHFLKELEEFSKKINIKKLLFEERDLKFFEYQLIKNLKPSPFDLDSFREIKDKEELQKIKKACDISDKAFTHILKEIKRGASEKEIAGKIINYIRNQDAEPSFYPIVAFGKNSSIPHHLSNESKLSSNQIVLLDFGAKVENYCSDMTRTVFFGSASGKFKNMYKTVLDAQSSAIEKLKTGIKASEIDKGAREIIAKEYSGFNHSLGHGIGLKVHESPFISPNSKQKLERGMVFSIEPGIYISGYGGVRIEDLVVISKNGPELISHANRGIIEI